VFPSSTCVRLSDSMPARRAIPTRVGTLVHKSVLFHHRAGAHAVMSHARVVGDSSTTARCGRWRRQAYGEAGTPRSCARRCADVWRRTRHRRRSSDDFRLTYGGLSRSPWHRPAYPAKHIYRGLLAGGRSVRLVRVRNCFFIGYSILALSRWFGPWRRWAAPADSSRALSLRLRWLCYSTFHASSTRFISFAPTYVLFAADPWLSSPFLRGLETLPDAHPLTAGRCARRTGVCVLPPNTCYPHPWPLTANQRRLIVVLESSLYRRRHPAVARARGDAHAPASRCWLWMQTLACDRAARVEAATSISPNALFPMRSAVPTYGDESTTSLRLYPPPTLHSA